MLKQSVTLFRMSKQEKKQLNALIPIVFEDSTCLVFNKPPGLLVIPTDKKEDRTMDRLVNEQNPDKGPLYPAHRLDRHTTGLIIFAKGKVNQERFMELFKQKKVEKEYIALVHGRLKSLSGKITIPVKDYYQRQFAKHKPSQSALTWWEVERYYKHLTVVRVKPVTGRTNQIRIHFSKIGHPLVGEDVYAFRKDFELRFKRYCLHAWHLIWPSLVDGRPVELWQDIPQDLEQFLDQQST